MSKYIQVNSDDELRAHDDSEFHNFYVARIGGSDSNRWFLIDRLSIAEDDGGLSVISCQSGHGNWVAMTNQTVGIVQEAHREHE